MNTYQYIAKDRNGHNITGVLDAVGEQEAIEALQNKELIVVSIGQAKANKAKGFKGFENKKIKIDDLVVITRQLATMVESGIPLVHALGILAEQIENKALKEIVTVVRNDIQAGMSFSSALAKHPQVFSELYINLVKAGETSGMLDEVLDRLAIHLEKTAALARKVSSSLIYPAIVVSMAIIITAVLLLKVVPTFKSIFDSLGGKLPVPTQVLIFISDMAQKYFLFLVILVVCAGILLKKYIATPKGRYALDRLKLKLPILGDLFRKIAIAKFARTFATLAKSGVSVLNALEIVSKTAGNKLVEEAVISCSKSIREGESVAKPLLKSGIFPPMVCRMISVGEQTGQLEKMLSKIADFYDEQIDAMTSGLTSMIEPLVICFLGTVIGGIVLALFLPIFKITELISQ